MHDLTRCLSYGIVSGMRMVQAVRGMVVTGLVTVAVLIGSAQPVTAQTTAVPANTAFQLQFAHDGVNVTGYRCYVDGKPAGADLPASARVGGTVTCTVPGQSVGAHTVQAAAFNTFGETRSATLAFTTGTPPAAPTNLQIVLQIAILPDGTAELRAFAVERTGPPGVSNLRFVLPEPGR